MDTANITTQAAETQSTDLAGQGQTFSAEQIDAIQAWATEDGWAADKPNDDGALSEPAAMGKTYPDAFGDSVSPAAYNFPLPPASLEAMSTEEQVQFRQVLAESGIPAGLGNEMARRWNMAMLQPQDATALQISYQQASAHLREKFGADAEEIIKLARSEAKRITKHLPGVHDALANTQLGNDQWLVETLANIARAKTKSF